MIDELELAFGEHAERGRPRHRRGSRRRKKKGGGAGRSVAALLIVLLLFGGLGAGAWYGYDRVKGFFTVPDYPGSGTGEAVVQVNKGDTATAIGNALYDVGVVKSAQAFVEAARQNSRSRNIQDGHYKLRKQMKASLALEMLLDPKSRWVTKVTIPEGMITVDIYARLAEASKLPIEDFTEAAKDRAGLGIADFWLKRDDGKKVADNIEGFLYPATYEFPPDATAEQMLKMMVEKFNQEMERLDFVNKVQKLSISPYEALIAASIVQAEAVQEKDMGPVARVLYNRAYKEGFFCSAAVLNCLGLDSSINYWLRLRGKDPKASEKILQSEINDKKNPYNTHVNSGMPLGPISNPGELALKGAMEPPKADKDYYFFVTIDDKGTMAYAATSAQHSANVRKACDNGVPICG